MNIPLLAVLCLPWGFPGGSDSKNPPATQEIQAWSLGWEDPLEKEMATHSSILAWRIPWTEKPGGVAKSWTRLKQLSMHASCRYLTCRTLYTCKCYEISPFNGKRLEIAWKLAPHWLDLCIYMYIFFWYISSVASHFKNSWKIGKLFFEYYGCICQ